MFVRLTHGPVIRTFTAADSFVKLLQPLFFKENLKKKSGLQQYISPQNTHVYSMAGPVKVTASLLYCPQQTMGCYGTLNCCQRSDQRAVKLRLTVNKPFYYVNG